MRLEAIGGEVEVAAERGWSILDYIILDQIKRRQVFDDHAMARQLHCSRLFLLERLERLLSEGYVTQEADAFALTQRGSSAWMPLSLYHEAVQVREDTQERFSWAELYIPRPGWSDP